MKKTVLLIVFLLGTGSLIFSQVVLTYRTHGLLAGTKNPMKLIEYIEPGNGGKGVVWDFSMIKEKGDFCGEIQEASGSPSPAAEGGDVILCEFNNRFVFSADENKTEMTGYFSAGNPSFWIKYDKPFVKMKYPFTYGSSYRGEFSGWHYVDGKKSGEIKGTYEVSADGTGTLVLPNGVTYKNALRVKEVKNTFFGNNTVYEEVTYRWYLKHYRFPVLVFIRTGYKNGGCNSFLSAYNPFVTEMKEMVAGMTEPEDFSVSLYPNPSQDIVNVTLSLTHESKVSISLYDAAGKYVASLASNISLPAGEHVYSFSANALSLQYGIYFLKVSVDGNESIKNFAIQ